MRYLCFQWIVTCCKHKNICNEFKTDVKTVKKSIVAVGHDTEGMKASDEAYNNLHGCCKYRDEEVRDNHKN